MADRVVLWDFDGTLAWRPGLWGGCVIEVLDELEPGHAVTIESVRAGLRSGFPWDDHEQPHPDVADAERWWVPVQELIANSVRQASGGSGELDAERVAAAVRSRFIDPTQGWLVFDDTVSALVRVADAGWHNVLLSNHVPELPELVAGLGLSDHFTLLFTSASSGYEKPHPEAFRIALLASGSPSRAWMVGDNPIADVQGAEAIGLPAILVRRDGQARLRTEGLDEAVDLILASED